MIRGFGDSEKRGTKDVIVGPCDSKAEWKGIGRRTNGTNEESMKVPDQDAKF